MTVEPVNWVGGFRIAGAVIHARINRDFAARGKADEADAVRINAPFGGAGCATKRTEAGRRRAHATFT